MGEIEFIRVEGEEEILSGGKNQLLGKENGRVTITFFESWVKFEEGLQKIRFLSKLGERR
jgi:hypothetical protein